MVPSKIQCFSFSIRHIPDNYSRTVYIIRQLRHHTLHIHVVNLCFIDFTDIRHNKCNNHAFYRHFQSTHFSEKHQLSPETTMTLKNTQAKNDTLKPYTASKNDILKLSLPPPLPRHISPGVSTLERYENRIRLLYKLLT